VLLDAVASTLWLRLIGERRRKTEQSGSRFFAQQLFEIDE